MNIESRALQGQRIVAPAALLAGQSVARVSPADVQVWVTRLARCRRELLAIALLDPAAQQVIERLAADVRAQTLRIGAVVDLRGESPAAARERLEAFRGALAGQVERGGLSGGSRDASPQPAAGAASDPLEAALAPRLALVEAVALGWDATERVLERSWVRAAAPTVARARLRGAPPALPASWRRRVRALGAEVQRDIQRLVAAHQGLVRMAARRYRGLGLSREDLVQEGNIGLLRAIEKFDASRGAPFGAYALWWVRQAIRRALASQGRTIRPPTTVLAARYALGRASSRLAHELGREPSDHELARAAGVAPESVADIMASTREPVSLDAPRGQDQSFTIGDRLSDPEARSPNDQAVAKDSASHLRALLGALSPRERLVLERRFGLRGEDEQTLEEIGRSLDLTRERVRQIIAQALDRLQRKTRNAHLEL